VWAADQLTFNPWQAKHKGAGYAIQFRAISGRSVTGDAAARRHLVKAPASDFSISGF
jgi:hypothetical protein